MTPRVGVVIPTLNSAGTLRAALLSVREQRGCTTEILVADSGSTDATLEICAACDVATIYVPPGNMYRAINEGLRRLHADWVAYLNSDDFVYADSYNRLVTQGTALGADVAYGGGDYVDADGRFLYSLRAAAPSALPALFSATFFGFIPHGAVFRKTVFEELVGFDENFRLIADMEFFGRACFAGKRFAAVPHPSVAAFRIHAGQLSAKESDAASSERARLKTVWGSKSPIAGSWAIARWKLGNVRNYFVRWLRTGRLRRAP